MRIKWQLGHSVSKALIYDGLRGRVSYLGKNLRFLNDSITKICVPVASGVNPLYLGGLLANLMTY